MFTVYVHVIAGVMAFFVFLAITLLILFLLLSSYLDELCLCVVVLSVSIIIAIISKLICEVF